MEEKRFLPLLGRAIATFGVVMLFFVIVLKGPRLRFSIFGVHENMSPAAARTMEIRRPPTGGDPSMWPLLPSGRSRGATSSTLNGVELISDDWICEKSPAELIDFFRTQMQARGWQDVTSAEFGLDAEWLNSPKRPMDEERMAQIYENVLGSNLVLRRPPWTLHFSTSQGSKSLFRRTRVSILCAKTRSIRAFGQNLLGGSPGSANSAPGRTLQSSSENEKEKYLTTIRSVSQAPEGAFRAKLEELGNQGWRKVVDLPPSRQQPGYFAWLTRGSDYAALIVNRPSEAAKTTVTFSLVSPKK